jgi:hypothetical protein
MQVAVRLGRETGMDTSIVFSRIVILGDDLLDEMKRFSFFRRILARGGLVVHGDLLSWRL